MSEGISSEIETEVDDRIYFTVVEFWPEHRIERRNGIRYITEQEFIDSFPK